MQSTLRVVKLIVDTENYPYWPLTLKFQGVLTLKKTMKNFFFIHPDSVRSHLVAKKEAEPTTMDSLVEYSKRDRGYVTNIVRDNEHIRFF